MPQTVTAPDPSEFERVDRSRQFLVDCDVTLILEIEADDKDAARAEARRLLAAAETGDDLDALPIWRLDEHEVNLVMRRADMFRVTRDGQPMQVAQIQPGDQPRAADPLTGF